jgi:hypothetical protein
MPRCQHWKTLNAAARRAAATPERAQSDSSKCSRCLRVKPNPVLRLVKAPELGPRRARIVCRECLPR